jgi:hypothetical protein
MNRRLLAALVVFAIALLATDLGGWLVYRRLTAQIATPAHRMGAAVSEPPSSSFFANSRGAGIAYITDPIYAGGAVGDGVHDDTAAINAAFNSGLPVHIPPAPGGGCYGVNAANATSNALNPPSGTTIIVEDRGILDAGTNFQNRICALSAMNAVISFYTSNSATEWGPFFTQGLQIDGANLAKYGILRNSDFESIYQRPVVLNVLRDAIHINGHRLPMILSAVTPGGGGAGGAVTVSQYDLGYDGIFSVAGTYNEQLKIATTGALNAATYVMSFDGGSTFCSFSQKVSGLSNVGFCAGNTFERDLGVQVGFASRTYTAGETYSWTITIQQEDTQANTINTDSQIVDPWIDHWGIGEFGGTITVVAGTGTGIGTSTTWLSSAPAGLQPRPGDSITVTGVGTLPIGSILDDTDLILPQNEVWPTSATGAAYTIHVGYAYYKDDSGDVARGEIRRGRLNNGSNGYRLAGKSDGNERAQNTRMDGLTGIDVLVGGGVTNPVGTHLENLECKANATNVCYYLVSGATAYIEEPQQQFDMTRIAGGGSALIETNGLITTYGSAFGGGPTLMAPQNTVQWIQSTGLPIPVTGISGGVTTTFQIQAPAVDSVDQVHTSYVVLSTSVDVIIESAPTITNPKANGEIIVIQNSPNSTGWITLVDHQVGVNDGFDTNLNMGCPSYAFAPGTSMAFQSGGGAPFSSHWEERWPNAGQFFGQSGHGGNSGRCVFHTTTTNATPTILQRWPNTVFYTENGALEKCDIAARDTGTGDQGYWFDVLGADDGAGHVLGTQPWIGGNAGTNSGALPATMLNAPIFQVASNRLQLLVTGASAHTISWVATCTSTANPK